MTRPLGLLARRPELKSFSMNDVPNGQSNELKGDNLR